MARLLSRANWLLARLVFSPAALVLEYAVHALLAVYIILGTAFYWLSTPTS